MRFILRVLSGPYELSVAGMGGAFMDKLGTGLPMGLFICSRFVLPYIRLHIHDLLLKEYFVIANGTYPYLFFFSFFFFFFGWGKGGKCVMHPSARGHRVWDSSTACRWAFSPVGQSCRLTYPLKPSFAGGPGHIPLCEVDYWTLRLVEVGEFFVSPKGSEFTLTGLSGSAFHEFSRVPAFSY